MTVLKTDKSKAEHGIGKEISYKGKGAILANVRRQKS